MDLLDKIAQAHIDNEGRGCISTAWIRSLSTTSISDGTWNRWLDLAYATTRLVDENGRRLIVRKCSALAAIRLMLLISYDGKSQRPNFDSKRTDLAIKGPELADMVTTYCAQHPDQVMLLSETSTALGVGFDYLPEAVAFVVGPEHSHKIKWRRVLRQQCGRAGVTWDQTKLYTHAEISAIADEVRKSATRGRPRKAGADAPTGDLSKRRRFA